MKSTIIGLKIFAFLFLVCLAVHAMPAKAATVTMTGYVTASYFFDVDTGQMAANSSVDLWYHNVDGVKRYLEPQDGALFANLGVVDFNTVTNVSAYSLSANPINASTTNNSIPIGAVLVVKTNLGNYAKMRIDGYPDPINFTIVYQPGGTPIVPEFSSLMGLALFLPASLLVAVVHRKTRARLQT